MVKSKIVTMQSILLRKLYVNTDIVRDNGRDVFQSGNIKSDSIALTSDASENVREAFKIDTLVSNVLLTQISFDDDTTLYGDDDIIPY